MTKLLKKGHQGIIAQLCSLDVQTSLEEWWYNTSFHTATKMIPFMAVYGYHPSSITSSLKEKSKVQAVEDHIEHQQFFKY